MVCSVLCESVKVIMNEWDNSKNPAAQGSALQSPDLSRAQLAAMLRRATRSHSPQYRQAYWTAFMDGYRSQHANGNINNGQASK